MANYISQIVTPSNDTYTIKDTNAITDIKVNGTTMSKSSRVASINSIPESILSWGGKNFAGSFGCIDGALVSSLGANRFEGGNVVGVTVEYSRDGGSTWVDYGASETQLGLLFNSSNKSSTVGIGKNDSTNKATANGTNYRLRVTITTNIFKVYSMLNKFVIYLTTSGSSDCWCKISTKTNANYTAGNDAWTDVTGQVTVSGWSGYNVINTSNITTYGNTSYQMQQIRFEFGANGGNTNYNGMYICHIMAFGGVGWIVPSNMAKTGHAYNWDYKQNVTFPNTVNSNTVNAVTIYENSKKLNAVYESLSNKVTSVSSSSTDTQYPSAKLTYNRTQDCITDMADNGDWYVRKHESGLYECWGTFTVTGAIQSAWGNVYYGITTSWNYPVTFKNNPYCSIEMSNGQGAGIYLTYGAIGSTSKTPTVFFTCPTSKSSNSYDVKIYARGFIAS